MKKAVSRQLSAVSQGLKTGIEDRMEFTCRVGLAHHLIFLESGAGREWPRQQNKIF
jgi:hypothetical protein